MLFRSIGVKTPIAAAVAEATVGLARDMHIPKGITLTIGTWSMMFAAGWFMPNTRWIGRTTSADGAAPIVHWQTAELTTSLGIELTDRPLFRSCLNSPWGCDLMIAALVKTPND